MPINSKHRDYVRMFKKWTRCRDTLSGQDAVHARGTEYLPRLSDQEDDEYLAYVKRATFFNATSRTVEALVGMIFRRQPVAELPTAMDPISEDATMAGVPLATFAQKVAYEVIGLGRAGVLVDMPRLDQAPRSLAEAEQAGVRPFLALYRAEEVINWRFERVNNRYTLTLAVLSEKYERDDGDIYATEQLERYRVLRLDNGQYVQEVWEPRDNIKAKDAKLNTTPPADQSGFVMVDAVRPMMNGSPMNYIPFILVGSDGPTYETDDPPLIDLVDLNLSHYRTTADYEHGAHFCGLPTPVVSGLTKETPNQKLYIGTTAAWIFPRPETKAYYLEFGGAGLGALSTIRNEKEQHMAALGARMLQPEKAAAEAEMTVLARSSGELSVLGAIAQGVSRAIAMALETAAKWADAAGEIKYELNTDYVPAQMTAPELTALVAAWQQGAISKQTLFRNLQRGEIIDEKTTFEDEDAAIGDEPPALAQQLTTLDAQHQQSLEAQEAAAKMKPKPGAK